MGQRLTVAVFGGLCAVLACGLALGAPTVSNVTAASSSVGRYDVFTVEFGVSTVATNLYWPYDETPNTGVPSKVGVSVDGLFSKDNWQTTVVQPGFYYQDYERQSYLYETVSRDWLYPRGDPCWRIKFTPTALGEWKYRIRVTDASGSTTYEPPNNSFACVASSNRGFVRVSSKDHRYFETDDESYLNLVGLSDYTVVTYDMDSLYSSYAPNGVNLLRVWWQGSQGPVLFGLSGQGGVNGWYGLSLATDVVRQGELFSGKITGNNACSTRVDVKPSTSYRYAVWVKTVGLTGAGDYGAFLMAEDCTQPNVPLTEKLKGDTEWRRLVVTVTTKAGQHSISYLKVAVSGTTSGAAYFTDVSLREDLGSGQYGPELVWRPSFDAEKDVSQLEAWKADYQVELTRSKGIYLKVCLQEVADVAFKAIHADGTAGAGAASNVYASNTHACRTYQQYFWRYIIARYGYATNIHSIEFCNEGDPFSSEHWSAAAALATYVHSVDPNQHLVTTSFWHSFPTKEFWNNPTYPGMDYADWHQYVGVGTDLQYVYGWTNGAVLDKTIYRSAPQSLHITSTGAVESMVWGRELATIPGHTYTIKCYIQGLGLTAQGSRAGSLAWIYPSIRIGFKSGWYGDSIVGFYPGRAGDYMGTYSWTLWSGTVTAPANAEYMQLAPTCHWAVGDCWFDDITVHDDTAGTEVEVPNGAFDSERLDFDSALMTYALGMQTGWTENRAVKMPVVRGEAGIAGKQVYGSPYRESYYTVENQQLVDDTTGVWYRKFVWGQINPSGIVDVYWWRENITRYGLTRYAKAFQSFMSGIPVSNGHYTDADAVTSVSALRAWGQKDLTNYRAHLWIDNARYTWKAVVDHNYNPDSWSSSATYAVDSTCGSGSPTHIYKSLQANSKNHAVTDTAWWQDVGAFNAVSKPPLPPLVTGTVTVSGFRDGAYEVQWWDTSTGAIAKTEELACTGGNLVLSVQGLQSDIACGIQPSPGKVDIRLTTSTQNPAPGEVVTITVEYTNSGRTDALNAAVTARVPALMDYVPGSGELSGGVYDSQAKSITWTIPRVPPAGAGTRTFQAKVR